MPHWLRSNPFWRKANNPGRWNAKANECVSNARKEEQKIFALLWWESSPLSLSLALTLRPQYTFPAIRGGSREWRNTRGGLFRCGWTDGVNPLGAERGNQSYWTKRIYTSWREVFPGLRGTVLFCDNTNLITQLLSPAPAVALLFLLPHYTKLQSTFSQPPTSSHFLAKLRRFLQFHQLGFFLRSTFMELRVYDDVRFLSSSSLNVNK